MHSDARSIKIDEKRAALLRVLESRTFVRCDQLKHFLSYVCELEFAGRGAEISEYGIGIDALGRPREFSPQEDSTVRSRAYSLRQKLQEYYEQKNPAASIRIDLPKGSYIPQFVGTPQEIVPAGSHFDIVTVPLPTPARAARWSWIVPFVLGVALTSLVWLALPFVRPSAQAKPIIDPIVAEAWGPLVSADANVAVCLSSPPHLHLHAYPEHTSGLPYSNPPLLKAPAEVTAFYETFRLKPPGTPVSMWRTNNSMLMGDVLAAVLAVRTLTPPSTRAAALRWPPSPPV